MDHDNADPGSEMDVLRPPAASAPMPDYTRAWAFDPYHQGLRFARAHDPGPVSADTEWPVFEVFQQERRGEHHQHVGSVHAPDAPMALVLAKESFTRRGHCVNLWVVPGACITVSDYMEADVFELTTDRSYREPAGFQGLRRDLQHGRGLRQGEASPSSKGPSEPGGESTPNAGPAPEATDQEARR